MTATALITERPPAGAPRPYAFPALTRLSIAGGEVLAADLPGQPLAVATLLLDGAAGREAPGVVGVAGVVLKALQEGTAVRDAAAYALALEGFGARLFTDVDFDAVEVGVLAPADRLLAAVGLLAEAVRTPKLATDDVARVRDDEAASLRVAWAGPGPRADAALRAAIFGDARVGRPVHGEPESLARLDVEAIVAHHRQWLQYAGTLLVAGDLATLDLAALAETAFAGTRPAVPVPGDLIAAQPAGQRRILLVDRPGAVQSTLRLGHRGPHRAHPDHVPTQLAGTVLGGAFTSRLNHLLREVRGYTYGIRGEFGFSRRYGRFTVSSAVQTAVTAPALVDAVAEIDRTRTAGVTEEELAIARTWRAGGLSVEMQTPSAIADALRTLVVHGLPDDYVPQLRQSLLAATADTVSPAAGRHLRPDDLTIVIDGDASVIRDEVAATGLGEVAVVDDVGAVS